MQLFIIIIIILNVVMLLFDFDWFGSQKAI